MRILFAFALWLSLPGAALAAGDGTLSVRRIDGTWTVTTPDGATLTVNQSTFGFPEALAYASAHGKPPLFAYCPGADTWLTFPSNYTLQIPAATGQRIELFGCALTFNNGAQPGIQMETFGAGTFKNAGGTIRYSGTGPAVLLRPLTPIPYGAGVPPFFTAWSHASDLDFGSITASGGTPEALLKIDVSAGMSTDPYLSSGFVAHLANPVKFTGQCHARARYGLLLMSPTTPRQLIAQNVFDFYVETCTESEIKIGTGGAGSLDTGLATNVYRGNPTHTVVGTNAPVVSSNAPFSYFWLNSANIEALGGAPYNFVFGPNAYRNVICTSQAFGGTSGLVDDQNADPSQPNTFSCGTPSAIPPPLSPPSGEPQKLLLQFVGADGSTTFTDASAVPHTVTGHGAARIVGNKLVLDAAGAYLDVPASPDWNFGPYDFAIELDLERTALGDMIVLGNWISGVLPWNGGWFLRFNSANQLWFTWDYGADRHELVSNVAITTSATHHVKVSRSGSTWRIELDGAIVASGTFNDTIEATNQSLFIGRLNIGALEYRGTLDNIRIVKGAAG